MEATFENFSSDACLTIEPESVDCKSCRVDFKQLTVGVVRDERAASNAAIHLQLARRGAGRRTDPWPMREPSICRVQLAFLKSQLHLTNNLHHETLITQIRCRKT